MIFRCPECGRIQSIEDIHVPAEIRARVRERTATTHYSELFRHPERYLRVISMERGRKPLFSRLIVPVYVSLQVENSSTFDLESVQWTIASDYVSSFDKHELELVCRNVRARSSETYSVHKETLVSPTYLPEDTLRQTGEGWTGITVADAVIESLFA